MDAEAQKRAIRELEAERAKLKAEAEKLLNRVE
jgi:cell division protein FtsB